MSNTLTTTAEQELITEIERLHDLAERRQADAIDGINDLIEARLSVATIAETAQANIGASFRKWWRDNLLPAGWDRKYITLAKTRKNLELTDKNQMRLIGIIPDIEHEDDQERDLGTARQVNPLAWVKIAGKLKATFTRDVVDRMDSHQRETAKHHLKPLVELYNALDE